MIISVTSLSGPWILPLNSRSQKRKKLKSLFMSEIIVEQGLLIYHFILC